MKALTIRLDSSTYDLLYSLANKRGESMAAVARRILSNNLQSETALEAQEILITAVRKAVNLELRRTENRLASLSAKTAITSATTENLVAYIIKSKNEHNLQEVRNACRKRGVAYVREPLEKIMQAYDEGGDN